MPRPKDPRFADDPPLLRVAPLYPSRSGKAFMGNVYVAEPQWAREDQPASTVLFGDVLIDMIKQCMEEKKPLRVLVFDNQGRGSAPFTLNVTIGRPKEEKPDQDLRGKPRAAWGAQAVPLPDDDDDTEQEPEAEPTPRPIPMRRGAPRR